jgi:hypothetical protein
VPEGLLELEVEGFKGRLERWWTGSRTYQGERGGNAALQRRPELAAVSGRIFVIIDHLLQRFVKKDHL